MTFMVNSVIRVNFYVSSVAFGGIPVGSDTTGDGSVTKPYLTLDRALSVAGSGRTIVMNGDPSNPTTYTTSAPIVVAAVLGFAAAFPQGAILAGNGASAVITMVINVAAALTLTNLIIDPSLSAAGPAAIGINMPVLPTNTTISVTCTGCLFRNWTDKAIVMLLGGRVNLTVSQCVFIGDLVAAGIYINGLNAGAISVSDTTITLARMNLRDVGAAIIVISNVSGVSVALSNVVATTTIDPAQVGSNIYFNVRVLNVPGVTATNCAFSILGNPGAVSGAAMSLEVGVGQSCDNPVFTNCTYTNTTNGGYGLRIGSETVSGRPFINNGQVIGGTITGGTAAANGDMHGVFFGVTNACTATGLTINNTGTPVVDKLSTNNQILNCQTFGATNSCLLAKGSSGSVYDSNIVHTSGGRPTLLRIEDDPTIPTHSTGIVVTHNQFIIDGGSANLSFIIVDASNTFSPANNLYAVVAGTPATNEFSIAGVNYTSCSAYKAAVEPTASCSPL